MDATDLLYSQIMRTKLIEDNAVRYRRSCRKHKLRARYRGRLTDEITRTAERLALLIEIAGEGK
jgi:hypothetical protein